MNLWTFLTGWALVMLGGCQAGCMSGFTGEITKMLREPAVQATIQEWTASGNMRNPRIQAFMQVSYGVEAIGVEAQGAISGDRMGGLNTDQLATLIDLALKRGYDPAKEPNVVTWALGNAPDLLKSIRLVTP